MSFTWNKKNRNLCLKAAYSEVIVFSVGNLKILLNIIRRLRKTQVTLKLFTM